MIKETWNTLGTPYKILAVVVVSIVLMWAAYGTYNLISNGVDVMVDNYKDKQLAEKDAELQRQKEENNAKIASLEAEKLAEREKRVALDVEIAMMKKAIENDGKIVASEQKKIQDAVNRYENEKDNCAGFADANAYTKCVCANIGVTCD